MARSGGCCNARENPISRRGVVTSSTVWPFALALMLGSALLFVIEPMLGKMLLPALGSAPVVWTTCMLFFQAALLVGYGYAHGVSAWLGPRRQAAIHVAALGIAALALPVTFRGAMESVPSQADPTGWLLAVLVRSAGPVFVVVAATAPSLQSWFAHTRGRGAVRGNAGD